MWVLEFIIEYLISSVCWGGEGEEMGSVYCLKVFVW